MAAKTGRPSKFTPEVRQKILDAIIGGATYKLAAEFAGISYDTFNTWLKKGEQKTSKDPDHELYVQFAEKVTQANAQMAVSALTSIRLAIDWQAKAWLLERRFPESYGKSTALDSLMKELIAAAKQSGVSVDLILKATISELKGEGDGT